MLKEIIRTSKTDLGKSDMTSGNKYQIRLRRKDNGKSTSFIYHDNYLNKSKKEDFVYCLLLDSFSYENAGNVMEFCREFGYEDLETGNRVYRQCKKQYDKAHRLFSQSEIEALDEELRELGY